VGGGEITTQHRKQTINGDGWIGDTGWKLFRIGTRGSLEEGVRI
jgi:hypothetical protein